jgi:hypothetical protein
MFPNGRWLFPIARSRIYAAKQRALGRPRRRLSLARLRVLRRSAFPLPGYSVGMIFSRATRLHVRG